MLVPGCRGLQLDTLQAANNPGALAGPCGMAAFHPASLRFPPHATTQSSAKAVLDTVCFQSRLGARNATLTATPHRRKVHLSSSQWHPAGPPSMKCGQNDDASSSDAWKGVCKVVLPDAAKTEIIGTDPPMRCTSHLFFVA